ncbi:MAG: hypothetical protein ABFS34_01045 [Gemmatimonadota bacterium]
MIACACRYARRASRERPAAGRLAYASKLASGLILLICRRFGPGVALVAVRGVVPKMAPALAALPALVKSAWVWLGGLSIATATAVSIGAAPAPVPVDSVPPAQVECAVRVDARHETCAVAGDGIAGRAVDEAGASVR